MDNSLKPVQEFREDCPRKLYHYTSLEALKGIVHQKKLVFWATRFDSMNDPVDYLFAANIVLPKLLAVLKQKTGLNDEETDYNEMYPYTVSFSEKFDDESMWKHYGSEVSLEINTDFFYPKYAVGDKVKFFFDKCVYADEEELNDSFFLNMLNSVNCENIPFKVQYACVYTKRKAFQREDEWRMFDADYLTGYVDADCVFHKFEMPQGVEVSCVKDKDLVLHKEFELPPEALTGIIINDNDPFHFQKVKKHIQIYLKQNGFPIHNISIRQTNNYPL